MSKNTSQNRLALYPNQLYRALVVGVAIDNGTTISDIGCSIIKNHFDKMPVEQRDRLIKISRNGNDYK